MAKRKWIDSDCLEKVVGILGSLGTAMAETSPAVAATLGVSATALGGTAVGLPLLAALGGGFVLRKTIASRHQGDCDALLKGKAAEVLAEDWPEDDPTSRFEAQARKQLETDLVETLTACIPQDETARDRLIATDALLNGEALADALLARAPGDSRFHGESEREYFTAVVTRTWDGLRREPAFYATLKSYVDEEVLSRLVVVEGKIDEVKSATAEIKDQNEIQLAEIAELRAEIVQLNVERDGLAAEATTNAFLTKEIEKARRAHDDDLATVANLLKILLNEEIRPEQFGDALARAEANAEALLEEIRRIPNDESPELRDLRLAAEAALKNRDFDEAERLRRERYEVRRHENRRTEAADIGAIADVRKARLDYRGAAALYAEAAATVDPADAEARWGWLKEEWEAIYRLGLEFGDNVALAQAIDKAAAMTSAFPRDTHPLLWAAAEANRALALQELGGREMASEKLEQAIEANRCLIDFFSSLNDLQNRATIQNNLGGALQTLGERENGTDRLEEAAAAYRAALTERTRERAPLDWAMTQHNLGATLCILGERENRKDRLQQAIDAYCEALKERTRERVPLYWADTQNNLGIALNTLGEREGKKDLLEQAIIACREALKEYTRERFPPKWATAQINLGSALKSLGELESSAELLEQAIFACREALKELTRERAPLQYATTHMNMANAIGQVGALKSDVMRFEQALKLYDEAIEVFDGCDAYMLKIAKENRSNAVAYLDRMLRRG